MTTNQETLERAIKLAIDGGWKPLDFVDKVDYFLVSPWLSVTFSQSDAPDRRIENRFSGYEVIFNQDFARAIWGDDSVTIMRFVADNGNQIYGREISVWQMHLAQMVIADDPIAYLGAHLGDGK